MDNRIGTFNADGSVKNFPAVNIVGQPYEKPANIVGLDAARFVVIPINYVDNGEVESLRASLKVSKGKSSE